MTHYVGEMDHNSTGLRWWAFGFESVSQFNMYVLNRFLFVILMEDCLFYGVFLFGVFLYMYSQIPCSLC